MHICYDINSLSQGIVLDIIINAVLCEQFQLYWSLILSSPYVHSCFDCIIIFLWRCLLFSIQFSINQHSISIVMTIDLDLPHINSKSAYQQ